MATKGATAKTNTSATRSTFPANPPPRLAAVENPISKATTAMKALNVKDTPLKTDTTGPSIQPNDPSWGSVRYNVPCKYYKLGTCKLGDQCRFLHTDKADEKPLSATTSTTVSGSSITVQRKASNGSSDDIQSLPPGNVVITIPNMRFARRPFLQIVVLFAADPRVMRYSKEVQSTFLDYGVDVYLQTEAENGAHIKTENLAEIITSSTADFLIVIGDRNMKNRSCQAKKKGKLVETDVEEMVNYIWAEWSQAQINSQQREIDEIDISKLTEEQVYNLLEKFTGLRHAKERLTRLKSSVTELHEWRQPLKGQLGKGVPVPMDEKIASKLTQTQQLLIRLHQQFVEVQETLQQMPTLEEYYNPHTDGKGQMQGPTFTPSNQKQGISEALKQKLLGEINRLLPKLESQGNKLSEFGSPLWDAYRVEYQSEKKKKAKGAPAEAKEEAKPVAAPAPSSPEVSSGSWSCSQCTYVNEEPAQKCKVCETPRSEDEWSLTGAAGKKQRKKQRATKEQAQKQHEEQELKRLKELEEKRKAEKEKQKLEQLQAQQAKAKLEEEQRLRQAQSGGTGPRGVVQTPASQPRAVPASTNPEPNYTNQSLFGTGSPFLFANQPQQYQHVLIQQMQQQHQKEQYEQNYPPLGGQPTSTAGPSTAITTPPPATSAQSIPGSTGSAPSPTPPLSSSAGSLFDFPSLWGGPSTIPSKPQQPTTTQPKPFPAATPQPQQLKPPLAKSYPQDYHLLSGIWSSIDQPEDVNVNGTPPNVNPYTAFNGFPSIGLEPYNTWGSAFMPPALGYSPFMQPFYPTPFPPASFPPPVQPQVPLPPSQPISPPTSSQPVNSSFSQEKEQFDKDQWEKERLKAREMVAEKYKNNMYRPQRPCSYCGEESVLECNLCAKMGVYPPTFFCSMTHQSLLWREHGKFHENQTK